jgi:hypothetical protein
MKFRVEPVLRKSISPPQAAGYWVRNLTVIAISEK